MQKIDKLLKSIRKSLKKFQGLPQPPQSYLQQGTNNLIIEETSYNIDEMEAEFNILWASCNEEQKTIFNAVLQSIQEAKGGFFLFMEVKVVERPTFGKL